ncbi:MAG TPA: hypothetical protein VMV74_06680 [Bacteroidales bacterium]|nr:hypothetical protein [Bacteroidales bacterium]
MNKKAILAIEIIWIILGILCLMVSLKEIFITKGDRAWLFALMSAVAFLMAWIRDRQRKKL